MTVATDRVTIAHIPTGQTIDLFTAMGCLVDAALNGAMLQAGDARDIAGTVVALEGMSEREVVTLLRAAARRLGKRPHRTLPEDDPDEDDGFTVHGMTATDSGVQFSIGRPEEVARETARHLLAAFVPAMQELNPVNYLEFPADDPETGQRYAVIVVKPAGLTPHQARQQAEAERDSWRRIAVQFARYGGSYYGLTPAERDLLEAEVREVNEADRDVVAERTADAASYHQEDGNG